MTLRIGRQIYNDDEPVVPADPTTQLAMDLTRRGRPEIGGAELDRAAGMGVTARGGTTPAAKPAAPTYDQYRDMVAQGRLRQSGDPGELKPSKKALDKAETPVDYGRLYGYSDNDIAHFYSARRGGYHPLGYQEWKRDMGYE